jgi:hypothetical protein
LDWSRGCTRRASRRDNIGRGRSPVCETSHTDNPFPDGDLDFLHRPRDHHRLLALEAEDPMAEPAARRDRAMARGEDVFPALPYAEAAASAADAAEEAAGDLILTTAAATEEQALVQLAVAARRLNRVACAEPDDETPEAAERIERAVLSALSVLRRRAAPDVARFLDDYADLQRDVLHHEPPAPAEAA